MSKVENKEIFNNLLYRLECKADEAFASCDRNVLHGLVEAIETVRDLAEDLGITVDFVSRYMFKTVSVCVKDE